jgi:glutaredoxin-like protein NrdH
LIQRKLIGDKEKEIFMQFSKVSGKKTDHKVTLYALSTCVWCKMTKQFLTENSVAYEFVDVDLLEDDEREKARQTIASKGTTISYPTIIVDNTIITGFRKDKLKEALNV